MAKQNQTLTIQQTPAVALPTKTVKAKLSRTRTQLLIKLGVRSPCCGARIATWHHDKFYCIACDKWLYRDTRK